MIVAVLAIGILFGIVGATTAMIFGQTIIIGVGIYIVASIFGSVGTTAYLTLKSFVCKDASKITAPLGAA